MAAQNYYQGVKHVVHISTDVVSPCEHCGKWDRIDIGLDERVNHYVKQHGYKLLHVGTETSHDDKGNPWHSTVVVVGK